MEQTQKPESRFREESGFLVCMMRREIYVNAISGECKEHIVVIAS